MYSSFRRRRCGGHRRILALALPVVLGLNTEDLPVSTVERCRAATSRYTQVLSAFIHQAINTQSGNRAGDQGEPCDGGGRSGSSDTGPPASLGTVKNAGKGQPVQEKEEEQFRPGWGQRR